MRTLRRSARERGERLRAKALSGDLRATRLSRAVDRRPLVRWLSPAWPSGNPPALPPRRRCCRRRGPSVLRWRRCRCAAARAGAQVVLLPEAADLAWTYPPARRLAEPAGSRRAATNSSCTRCRWGEAAAPEKKTVGQAEVGKPVEPCSRSGVAIAAVFPPDEERPGAAERAAPQARHARLTHGRWTEGMSSRSWRVKGLVGRWVTSSGVPCSTIRPSCRMKRRSET